GCDAKIILYDGGGFDRGDSRSPRHHLSHAGRGRPDRARGRAGIAGTSELPDVVCGYARAGSAGADRHAEPVRCAGSFDDRAAAMVVDRQRLATQGTLALTQRGDGFAVQAVKARGTNRPWLPAAA